VLGLFELIISRIVAAVNSTIPGSFSSRLVMLSSVIQIPFALEASCSAISLGILLKVSSILRFHAFVLLLEASTTRAPWL